MRKILELAVQSKNETDQYWLYEISAIVTLLNLIHRFQDEGDASIYILIPLLHAFSGNFKLSLI